MTQKAGKPSWETVTLQAGSSRRSIKETNLSLAEEKREKTQLNNICIERMDVTTDLMGAQRIVQEYH